MCGIHGVLSATPRSSSALSKFIEQGFMVNVVRGMDSSGVFQVDRKGKSWSHKLALPGPFFVENKITKTYTSEAAYARATVCHVRAATMGKVNIDNAHPFVGYKENGSHIVGVHNGTLQGWHSRKGAKLYDVDSDWAMSRIAEDGADAFEDFTGAWAFVWFDSDHPNKIFMARNKERPLHFIVTPDGQHLLFASEPGMLSWLCDRNDIKVKDQVIHVLEEGKLYVFDTSGTDIRWEKSNLPTPRYSYSGTYTSNTSSTGTAGTGSVTNNTSSTNTTGRGVMAGDSGLNENDIATIEDDDIPFNTEELPDDAVSTLSLFRAALESSPTVVTAQEVDDNTNVVRFPPRKLSKRERKRLRREQQQRERQAEQRRSEAENDSSEGFGSDLDVVPDGYFRNAAATPVEMNIAKSTGIYGKMMLFVGTMYDPDTAECWGEIEDFIPGGVGKVRYQAVIRNTTASVAHRVYINGVGTAPGVYVAVIGRMGEDKAVGGGLVVDPLTREGVEKFAKALS